MTRSPEGDLTLYRAPQGTLFVYDRTAAAWQIVCWDGSEACVPERDLAAFFRRYRRRATSPSGRRARAAPQPRSPSSR